MSLAAYTVTLRGKWGGVRTTTVRASSLAAARKQARLIAYVHETVMNVSGPSTGRN